LIDTHAHLDEPAFDHDRASVLAAARAAGVTRIVNIGYRPARWVSSLALARAEPMIALALGLHPHHADEFGADTLDRLADAVSNAGAVALGEIGLDFYRNRAEPAAQRRAFIAQLQLARRLGLPIIIHQRAAEEALIEVLAAGRELPPVVLHSFDGTADLAALAINRGFLIGVGGLATKTDAAPLRQILASVPVSRVLLETDAPYLTPAGIRDRRNVPANLPLIAARLASLWEVSPDEFAAQTTTTALAVFWPHAPRDNPVTRQFP
jgi:TatD DNase family protein